MASTVVPQQLETTWQVCLGGTLTSPTAAQGRVYTAKQEDRSLYALDQGSGRIVWKHTAEARIDSPPTLYGGRVYFGSTGGYITCLNAEDGALVWRFRAAPRDQRLISYDRLESVWPVHGSVLIQDGIVSCVAGRSTFLDGGLRFLRLDARTGKLLSEEVLYDQQNPQRDVKVLNMPAALPDILASDGQYIYMRSQVFDKEGKRIQTVDPTLDPFDRVTQQCGTDSHLFCPTGFLDDEAWHRSYWIFGRVFSSGCNWWFRAGRYAPAGRLLVYDDERVYGFGREPGLFVWSHVLENHIFCSERSASTEALEQVKQWSKKAGRDGTFNRRFTRNVALEKRLAPKQHWSVSKPPLHARALVLALDTLFVAGPPDLLNEDRAFENPNSSAIKKQLLEQDAAYAGERAGLLLGYTRDSGDSRCKIELPTSPVWDGMIAVRGHLVIALQDGSLLCLGKKRGR